MALREPYHEYVLEADPKRRGDKWQARIVIEAHEHGARHFQAVDGDPAVTYGSYDEAARASMAFGKSIIDVRLTQR